jgi:PAS domain S-box-containing protein
MTPGLFGRRAVKVLRRAMTFFFGAPLWGAAPDAVLPADTDGGVAREAAEALSRRSTLGVLVYPVLLTLAVAVSPGASSRLAVTTPCGLLLLLLAGERMREAFSFGRLYAMSPARWRRRFRLEVYGCALAWVVFAVHEMSAGGAAWPTYMLLLMTAAISAGGTTSLCPDPSLAQRYLLILLGPLVLWGLARGGPEGIAIVIDVSVCLVFLEVQVQHNSQSFWRSLLDRQALREASRRREALVNSIDGIIWDAGPQRSRFTFVSGRAKSILGYPVSQWLTEPSFWADHIHPDDRERVMAHSSSEAAARGDYSIEYRMVAADGRAVWLRDIVSPERGASGCTTLCGVMVDVTAHKQASDERDLLAKALCAVGEAVTITDLEDRIVFANDSFVTLYGYTRDEILGRRINLVRSAKNLPETEAAIAEGTRQGGWQGEVWNRRKNGEEFPIFLSTTLVRNAFGRTVAQTGVARDITSRKREEAELRRAKEAAEAGNRAKCEFLANMRHELRTPMNGILGMDQLLLDSPLEPRQRRWAEVVRDSANSLLSVLNDILDLSSIETGRLELESVHFDPASVVREACDLLAVKARTKGLKLLSLIDPDVPASCYGDPGRLRQVLTSLVGNAVKFTETGEISIRVCGLPAGPPAILRFEVDDTGIGVPPDRQALLFEPFSQGDACASRRHGGIGLGLTLVHRLVEMMGGQVGYQSLESQGSRFWFTAALPPGPGLSG